MLRKMVLACVGVLLPAGLLVNLIYPGERLHSQELTAPSFGDANALERAYVRWAESYEEKGGGKSIILPLGYTKALSAKFTKADAEARIDTVTGAITVVANGLSEGENFEFWLVDNQPGPDRSIKPESGDRMISLGRLKAQGSSWVLETQVSDLEYPDFRIDLVAIGPSGTTPDQGGLIFGSPSLFQKLYYERREQFDVRFGAVEATLEGETLPATGSYSFLIPKPAYAQAGGPDAAAMQRLVRRGERLFMKETFNGNGRTCASCHPPENNFTIDPLFIASLPDHDPLFVAEFNPNLRHNFEKPRLMREFGLILENTNGFDPAETNFTLRATSYTLALPMSIVGPGGQPRLGWSGDGAPAPGTLRAFAVGAVRQHFPKSLGRQPGVDFRFPTDAELDAMEAFQLSLGRQEELSLPLPLKGTVAKQGQDVFLDNDVGKCNRCHRNAGANVVFGDGSNFNFNTGVEAMTDAPAQLTGELVPADDGFGNPGDGTFNTPSLVEAADTGPFFHNHSVETIEGAVAFYNSDAFNSSPSAAILGPVRMTTPQVVAVAGFLRVINALENIRSAEELQQRALSAQRKRPAKKLLKLALAETNDAIEVLSGGGLHPEAVILLKRAAHVLDDKRHRSLRGLRGDVRKAMRFQQAARADMINE